MYESVLRDDRAGEWPVLRSSPGRGEWARRWYAAFVAAKKRTTQLTAALQREGKLYIAQCLEVDVASQGGTVEEALANLAEALELRLSAF